MKTISKIINFVFVTGFLINPHLGQSTEADVSREHITDLLKQSRSLSMFTETDKITKEDLACQICDANSGDYYSQWHLGLFFEDVMDKHPTYKDSKQAEKYLLLAAEKKSNYCINHHLGYFYQYRSKKINITLAQHYYEIAAHQWNGQDGFNHAFLKFYGNVNTKWGNTYQSNLHKCLLNIAQALKEKENIESRKGQFQDAKYFCEFAEKQWNGENGKNFAKITLDLSVAYDIGSDPIKLRDIILPLDYIKLYA